MVTTRRKNIINVIASPTGAKQSAFKNQIASSAFGLLAMTLLFIQPVLACPMCNDIVGRGKDALASMRFGSGIGWSIFAMLGILFSLMGSFVWIIVRGANRKKETASGTKS